MRHPGQSIDAYELDTDMLVGAELMVADVKERPAHMLGACLQRLRLPVVRYLA